MTWLDEGKISESILLAARTCVYADSGRLPNDLLRLTFDDAEICTTKFAELIQHLLSWSGDACCYYVVLRPDPADYFHRLFGKYPIIEIGKSLSPAGYIEKLNEGPHDSPSDAAGTNWWESVIFPLSNRWFVHALRSDLGNGGHLWVPADWAERVVEVYPYATISGACDRP